MTTPMTFPKFDPVAVNRTIDNMLAAVPQGQRGILVFHGDLQTKKGSAALMFKVTNNIGAFVRVSKVAGQPVDVDAGGHISFLYGAAPYDAPELSEYTYPEVVAVFKARGWGWIKSHLSALRLVTGGEVWL